MFLGTYVPVLGILVREPQDKTASEASAKVLTEGGSGGSDSSHLNYLRYQNGTIENFGSCSSACQKCFLDHFQACLAYCRKGCQEYCEEKLSEEECKDENPDEEWLANEVKDFPLSNPER